MKNMIAGKPATFSLTLILILASTLIGLASCEFFLRYRQKIIKAHDLDQGFIQYDNLYGWKLSPGWKGHHFHHDFNVYYTINSYGFRGRFDLPTKQNKTLFAFVGDSFTFGQGVNDKDTFVELLNNREGKRHYLNFSIPGFSTDQEYLLINNRVLNFSPEVVIIVTYLGNDLFDNLLGFPLQSDNAKPYFEFSNNELILKNTPVPMIKKQTTHTIDNLRKVGLLKASKDYLVLSRLKNLELFKFIENIFYAHKKESAGLAKPYKNAIDIFEALLKRIHQTCIKKKAKLCLVLMPGKTYVEKPDSLQAEHQEIFRKQIIKNTKFSNIQTFDLASYLKNYYRKNKTQLFFPFEGHLNEEGHRVTANFLNTRLGEIDQN